MFLVNEIKRKDLGYFPRGWHAKLFSINVWSTRLVGILYGGEWTRQNTYSIFFAEREQWHNVCSAEYRGGGASKSVIGKKFRASKRDFTTLSPAVDHSRSRKRDLVQEMNTPPRPISSRNNLSLTAHKKSNRFPLPVHLFSNEFSKNSKNQDNNLFQAGKIIFSFLLLLLLAE